jgi:hypothetical protein
VPTRLVLTYLTQQSCEQVGGRIVQNGRLGLGGLIASGCVLPCNRVLSGICRAWEEEKTLAKLGFMRVAKSVFIRYESPAVQCLASATIHDASNLAIIIKVFNNDVHSGLLSNSHYRFTNIIPKIWQDIAKRQRPRQDTCVVFQAKFMGWSLSCVGEARDSLKLNVLLPILIAGRVNSDGEISPQLTFGCVLTSLYTRLRSFSGSGSGNSLPTNAYKCGESKYAEPPFRGGVPDDQSREQSQAVHRDGENVAHTQIANNFDCIALVADNDR